ncbi:MAG: FIST N-terminal domain-containing protein [Methanosarcinales archaeon]
MNAITFFTNKREAESAAFDLIDQTASAERPDLLLFYATPKYRGRYQQILEILATRFGNIPQIGGSVDGMIFPSDMRTDGASLVLCYDESARIWVGSDEGKGACESAERLAEKITCKNGIVILHFPLVHVPDMAGSIEFWTRGRYYSFMCRNRSGKYARRFADYCNRNKIIYPAPTILDIVAKRLDYRVPIIGINLMHTEMGFNSPSVFANFKEINNSIAALAIEKPGIEVSYDDIFPAKGKTIEETCKIVKNHFTVVKEFKASFEKNILLSLDDKPPIAAIKDFTGLSKHNREGITSNLGEGHLQAQMPYILIYLSKTTGGIMTHAVGSYYPFDLFPVFFDISDFSEKVFLAYEPFQGKLKDFASSLCTFRNTKSFKFFVMDIGAVLAFEEESIYYRDMVAELFGDNYFGLLTEAPSVYLPPSSVKKEFITEVKKNIFFSCSGTDVCFHC